MVWLERNLPIMLILVVCLALWDISNCAVISSAPFPNWDDKEWWKNVQNVPTIDWKRFTVDRDVKPPLAPFDWNKLALKRFDWDEFNKIPTPGSIDWNRFTFDWDEFNKIPTPGPIDWDRFTFDWDRFNKRQTPEPFDWNRITLPPRRDFHYIQTDNTLLKLAIFLPTTIGIVIVLVCKFLICNGERNSDSSLLSTPILQPPRRMTAVTSTQNIPWTTQNARQNRSPGVSIAIPRRNDSSSRSNDRPPGYSDVVIADLSGNVNTFPAVKPTIPETPPPSYDDKIMRY